MTVPITITCECGKSISAELGDEVSCDCGRSYDTSTLGGEKLTRLHAMRVRVRIYTYIGIVLIAGVAIGTGIAFGLKGAAIAGPAAALIWFRFVAPRYKRRYWRISAICLPGRSRRRSR